MSLQGKRTKWKKNLEKRAYALHARLALTVGRDAAARAIAQELGNVAAHFYQLGRAAGIAEGRRRGPGKAVTP